MNKPNNSQRAALPESSSVIFTSLQNCCTKHTVNGNKMSYSSDNSAWFMHSQLILCGHALPALHPPEGPIH